MPELSRRERKKKETYEKLFSSAMHLFRTQGFESTSVEQITQHADVGKGTFYNYFDSKEAVIFEFSRRTYQDILNLGRERKSSSIRERLEILLEEWTDFLIKDREFAWVAIRNRERAEFDVSLHYGLVAILTLAQREGEISRKFDPSFLAESLEGMVLQHFVSWYVTGEGDLKEEMKRVLALFLNGLTEHRLQA